MGLRETRNREIFIVVCKMRKGERKLSSIIAAAVEMSGVVRHLILKTEVEILNVDPTTEREEVEEALRRFFGGKSPLKTRVSMTRTLFR